MAVVVWLALLFRVFNPAVDETAKTPAIASPARLRKLFRFEVGLLSMRRKIDMLKVPLNAMANVFSQPIYTDFVDF